MSSAALQMMDFSSVAELHSSDESSIQLIRPYEFLHSIPGITDPKSDSESNESTLKLANPIANGAFQTARNQADRIQSSFVAEQEWQGYVTSFDDQFFYARLLDLTTQGVEEDAQFEIEDISTNHRSLLKEGAIFRWSIGYERLMGGTKRRISSIVFRRLPAWTKKELEESLKEAESLIRDIQWT